MGFCIFNNVAVAAQLATKKYGANKVSFDLAPAVNHRSIAAYDRISNIALTSSNECRNILQVLIVDWDVHHGNGTQNMFLQVLMMFTH